MLWFLLWIPWIQLSTYSKGRSRKYYFFFFEFRSFVYKVMSFGLKNSPTILCRIVVKEFQEYIYKRMVVYFSEWTMHILPKDHVQWLRMMLERWCKMKLYLNIKQCIFSTPVGILLGHIVCKDGIKVDMAKIKIILKLKPLVNKKHMKIFLRHKGYYKMFIWHYSDIRFPINEILKKEVDFQWSQKWEKYFELLKRKLIVVPILRFLNWSRKFYVHVDASNVMVWTVLAKPYDDMVYY